VRGRGGRWIGGESERERREMDGEMEVEGRE
jgi:hypothetical protein